MSLPRAVVPGRTYMITRRCSERRFFLRPDRETNNAFIYCLAVAAQKYGVKVIFTATMSNHHHTGVVDLEGNLPDFERPVTGGARQTTLWPSNMCKSPAKAGSLRNRSLAAVALALAIVSRTSARRARSTAPAA